MATTLPDVQSSATGGALVVEQPESPGPPTFGENNRHLPDILKDTLTAIVKEFQQEDLYDRRIEDLTDRIHRFYDDGVQHVYPNYGTGVYQVGSSGAYVDLGNGDGFECGQYMGAYNIFRARRRTIDAVLTQNPPGIDFQPDRPDRSEDIQAAETAEGYRHLFDQKNDVSDIQQSITRYFELSGRVVAWTRTVANQQKWGINDQGKPRRMETAEVFGTLESTVPILCRDQDYAIYCFLYRDVHFLKLRSENPWLREGDTGAWKFAGGESGLGESEWKRYARLGVKQARKGFYLTGTALAHVTTEMHAFLRPESFMSTRCDELYTGPSGWDDEAGQYVTDPAVTDDGDQMTIRDMLEQLFPEGVRIKYCGQVYAEAFAESMDDALDIVMSEKRDSLTGGALMEPMKIIQDGFNDFKNAEREYYEKGWPMTHFRGDGEDYDAIVVQASKPAQFNLIKSPIGPVDRPLADNFYREPDMQVPESFVECMEEYRTGLSQDITGASPALQGVAGPHDQTATERAMDKVQSVGILGPTWSRVQRVFAGIYKKAALLASKNPDHGKDIVVTGGDGQQITIVLEHLTRGRFHAKPDTDSTFPESTAAQRSNLDQTLPVIAPTPIGAEILSSPDNWEEIFRIKGMSNFTVTPAIAFKKQIREIEILTREAPAPNDAAISAYNAQHAALTLQAGVQGLPPLPYAPPPAELPSIQPRKRDYHQWEYAKCREWLSSEDCWRLEVEDAGPYPPSPMPGYSDNPHVRNVELHADMHQQMMLAEMPPAPPVAAPAGQKPGSPAAKTPPPALGAPASGQTQQPTL
jgi:hypothetical protein